MILTMDGSGADAMVLFRNATVNANGVVHSEYIYALLESGAGNSAYIAGTEITLGT